MFFYTSLIVFNVVMALVILWLYRLLMDAGYALYRSIMPSSGEDAVDHVKDDHLTTTINDIPIPWGWQRSSLARVAKNVAPVPKVSVPSANPIPWGWKGNKHKVQEYKVKEGIWLNPVAATSWFLNGNKAASAGRIDEHPEWPDREDEFEFAGASYRVTRKIKPKKANLKNVTKPWGW